ncbi:MAG: hypothetical protein CVV60_00840 [Tenericutes bacterium HGW-Tenericutes-5]|nr:MAG: hypothetical protein CVV60_00840 [Tenericutes bacterium HGW-Tenericutes-5]
MILYAILFEIGFMLFLGSFFINKFIRNELESNDEQLKLNPFRKLLLRISMFVLGIGLILFVLIMTIEP